MIRPMGLVTFASSALRRLKRLDGSPKASGKAGRLRKKKRRRA
jgi:hypothetical protein